MSNALTKNKNYLLRLLTAMEKDFASDETWHKERRLAESANNKVFTSVQRMLEEPGHARTGVDVSLSLVGANIRMSREITSVALELENRPLTIKLNPGKFPEKIAQAFDQVILILDGQEQKEKPDFNSLKEVFNLPQFSQSAQTEFIRTELEKVVFELEAVYVLSQRKELSLS